MNVVARGDRVFAHSMIQMQPRFLSIGDFNNVLVSLSSNELACHSI